MKNLYVLALISILLLSCSDGDDPDPGGCDLVTVISQERYRNDPSEEMTINILEIEDDCLKINFSASGCDGESWKIVLIDSGSILESVIEIEVPIILLVYPDIVNDVFYRKDGIIDFLASEISSNSQI